MDDYDNDGAAEHIRPHRRSNPHRPRKLSYEDERVMYGASIRLKTRSCYADDHLPGGFLGIFYRHAPRRSRSGRAPLVTVPPAGTLDHGIFIESEWKILDKRGGVPKDPGGGIPEDPYVRYGEDFILQENSSGGTINANVPGHHSYLQIDINGSNGEALVQFSAAGRAGEIVKFGDKDVSLMISTIDGLWRYRQPTLVTNFRMPTSRVVGGYAVADGQGYPLMLRISRPPPSIQQLVLGTSTFSTLAWNEHVSFNSTYRSSKQEMLRLRLDDGRSARLTVRDLKIHCSEEAGKANTFWLVLTGTNKDGEGVGSSDRGYLRLSLSARPPSRITKSVSREAWFGVVVMSVVVVFVGSYFIKTATNIEALFVAILVGVTSVIAIKRIVRYSFEGELAVVAFQEETPESLDDVVLTDCTEKEENDAERELRQLLNKATTLTGPEANRVRELMRQTADGGELAEEADDHDTADITVWAQAHLNLPSNDAKALARQAESELGVISHGDLVDTEIVQDGDLSKLGLKVAPLRKLKRLRSEIKSSSSVPDLPVGAKFHAFISHEQAFSQDQSQALYTELRRQGFKVWYDMSASKITVDGMLEGVKNSACCILFLNTNTLEREMVQMEVREAVRLCKPFVVIHETDGRHGAKLNEYGSFDFKYVLERAPQDLVPVLNNHEAIRYERRGAHRKVMLDDIIAKIKEACHDYVTERRSAPQLGSPLSGMLSLSPRSSAALSPRSKFSAFSKALLFKSKKEK
jgi:hypothetical protein